MRMARVLRRVDVVVMGEEMAAMTSVALSVAAVACVVQVREMQVARAVAAEGAAVTKAIRQDPITAIRHAQPRQARAVVVEVTVVTQAAILLTVTVLTMIACQAASILNAR